MQTQNYLRAARVLIAFPAIVAETKQQDDASRCMGHTYCIGITVDGPYAAADIFACNHIVIV